MSTERDRMLVIKFYWFSKNSVYIGTIKQNLIFLQALIMIDIFIYIFMFNPHFLIYTTLAICGYRVLEMWLP